MTTRRPWEGYPAYHEPCSVNLLPVQPVPLYDGGYYLFAGPRVSRDRLGVVLAVRERNRVLYRIRARCPRMAPWVMALSEVLELDKAN